MDDPTTKTVPCAHLEQFSDTVGHCLWSEHHACPKWVRRCFPINLRHNHCGPQECPGFVAADDGKV